jgi:hypothetical protein
MRKNRSFDYSQRKPAPRDAARSGGTVLRRAARSAWWWLRQVSGDAAYDNYLRAIRAAAARAAFAPDASRSSCRERMLSPEEFYLDSLRRRYSGASRCC